MVNDAYVGNTLAIWIAYWDLQVHEHPKRSQKVDDRLVWYTLWVRGLFETLCLNVSWVDWTTELWIHIVNHDVGVSKNRGTPKSSIFIGFSIIFTIHFGVPCIAPASPEGDPRVCRSLWASQVDTKRLGHPNNGVLKIPMEFPSNYRTATSFWHLLKIWPLAVCFRGPYLRVFFPAAPFVCRLPFVWRLLFPLCCLPFVYLVCRLPFVCRFPFAFCLPVGFLVLW